jgi:hypothetical protein
MSRREGMTIVRRDEEKRERESVENDDKNLERAAQANVWTYSCSSNLFEILLEKVHRIVSRLSLLMKLARGNEDERIHCCQPRARIAETLRIGIEEWEKFKIC